MEKLDMIVAALERIENRLDKYEDRLRGVETRIYLICAVGMFVVAFVSDFLKDKLF